MGTKDAAGSAISSLGRRKSGDTAVGFRLQGKAAVSLWRMPDTEFFLILMMGDRGKPVENAAGSLGQGEWMDTALAPGNKWKI